MQRQNKIQKNKQYKMMSDCSSDKITVQACYSKNPLFRRSATPKVHCADTPNSANIWVKVRVKVRVKVKIRVKVSFRVSENSRLSE